MLQAGESRWLGSLGQCCRHLGAYRKEVLLRFREMDTTERDGDTRMQASVLCPQCRGWARFVPEEHMQRRCFHACVCAILDGPNRPCGNVSRMQHSSRDNCVPMSAHDRCQDWILKRVGACPHGRLNCIPGGTARQVVAQEQRRDDSMTRALLALGC